MMASWIWELHFLGLWHGLAGEVLQLDAQVVDVATENGQQIVSVRFWGLIREQSEQAAADFDEVWHLSQSGEGWLIAGIQQTA